YLEETDKVGAMIKENFDVPCVWGGVYATLETKRTLENGYCNMVLRGEGETNIVKLAHAFESGEDWRTIDGIAYINESGEYVANDVGECQQDLDEYGYPIIGGDNMYLISDDKLIEGDPQLRAFSYELAASRGCPFTCSYCSTNSLRRVYDGKKGRYVRFRSVDSVLAELNEAKRKIPKIRVIHFWDEIFCTEQGWMEEFCRRYKAEIGIPFRVWGHPLMVNEKTFSMLVDAGLHQVVMGIQSGSPYIRKDVFHRNETQEQVIRASAVLQKCKVPVVYYDLMICHPFESEVHLKETFEFCLQLVHPFRLNMHGLNFLPSTDITQMALDQGLRTPEEMEKELYSSLKDQYDRWGPHSPTFHAVSRKNSWSDLIYLTQFPKLREKVIELAKEPEKNREKIAKLKRKMNRRQELAILWDKGLLVLKLSK
ncbi:MAG: radical SAM protein, partial [Oscillospiraceae bacterium]|nr:radical SAM protein [Oscillospiraceae bacterium]